MGNVAVRHCTCELKLWIFKIIWVFSGATKNSITHPEILLGEAGGEGENTEKSVARKDISQNYRKFFLNTIVLVVTQKFDL